MLEKVNSPKDLKCFSEKELDILCGELRTKLLDIVSKNGGHLASNLGITELTVALHYVFDSPSDKIIFDVGHQSYIHKMLTGRLEQMGTLRRKDGIAGFPRRSESEHDAFGGGHSGNAFSAGLGMACASKIDGKDNYVVSVIGDGSFTNGMVFEAMNNCADKNLNYIIVLNDNDMSISKNVGGLAGYCSKKRSTKTYFHFKKKLQKILRYIPFVGEGLIKLFRWGRDVMKRLVLPSNLFEDFGLDYIGPVDGNNVKKLITVLNEAKSKKNICVVHILTQKGKGYTPAEENPSLYHAVSPFNKDTGIAQIKRETFSSVFGREMCLLAENDCRICAVTAAMCDGTGLAEFESEFPDRFFDVGIAEEHAVTFCGGLAAAGKIPVFAVYSSFLQRCYDQLVHDIAIQDVHAVVCVDRSGLVEGDGITHQGVFDLAMAFSVPGVTVYCPQTFEDLRVCLRSAVNGEGLCVVRYPRGGELPRADVKFREENGFYIFDTSVNPTQTVITYGRLTSNVCNAAVKSGASVRIIKLLRVNPIDVQALFDIFAGKVTVIEESESSCSLGSKLASVYDGKIYIRGIDGFAETGNRDELFESFGFDTNSLCNYIKGNVTEDINRRILL